MKLCISQCQYLKFGLFRNIYRHSLLRSNAEFKTIATCLPLASDIYNKRNSRKFGCKLKNVEPYRDLHTSFTNWKIVPFVLADIGEGIMEVVIKQWYVNEGDRIAQFDNVCEVQSDKASVTITSRYDGVIGKLYYQVDDVALVGKPLLDVEVEREDSSGTVGAAVQEGEAIPMAKTVPGDAGEESQIQLPVGDSKALAAPAVRRIAMEKKVDLRKVIGTGKEGRILKEDVLKYIDNQTTLSSPESAQLPTKPSVQIQPPTPPPKDVPTPASVSPLKQDRVEKIKGYKRAMVKTMSAALQIPHFVYCDEVDMTTLVDMKSQFKALFAEHNLRFTFTPIFIKAVSMALAHYPGLNAVVDENCENITCKANHNISVAMDTIEGLVVPNIKSVQELSILDITKELTRLQICGQQGNFSTTDLSGGTFTFSNIGSIGGTYAKPVILAPQVAIGAVGKVQKVPRFGPNNQIVPAQIMNVSWSADHRVVDGATMARFSNKWKSYLEHPAAMVFHMK